MKKGDGKRFNEGKLRYDLVHPIALEGLVKVLTQGSIKYDERNWEKGMKWTSVIASLKRHLAAIERGEDYDKESGLLHIDHVQCNAHFISAYYKIFPEGDDRPIKPIPKIGLDIDEVLADFVGGWMKKYKIKERPTSWHFDPKIPQRFAKMKRDGTLNAFMLSLRPLVDPMDIPFEPHCYITSRSVPSAVTAKWILDNGFPNAPVYTVPMGASKVDVAKEAGIEVFVDDKYETFVEMNNAGIMCYLFDQPHNRRYSAGHYRIKSLSEVI